VLYRYRPLHEASEFESLNIIIDKRYRVSCGYYSGFQLENKTKPKNNNSNNKSGKISDISIYFSHYFYISLYVIPNSKWQPTKKRERMLDST